MTTLNRSNFENYLDNGCIETCVNLDEHGAKQLWWIARRNSATKRWKRDANRIRVAIKAGLSYYNCIDDTDFVSDGSLDPARYRIKPGV